MMAIRRGSSDPSVWVFQSLHHPSVVKSRNPRWLVIIAMLAVLALLLIPQRARGATATGFAEYFIPGDEEQMYAIFRDLPVSKPVDANSMHSVIAVTAASDETWVYYDHWEDGYDFDIAGPATADEAHLLSRGQVHVFESASIPVNPRGTGLYYDGRDRIFVVGGAVTVTRASWLQATGTVHALAWELYPIKPLRSEYTIPVGEELASAPTNYDDFDRVYVIVQSVSDGNAVQIDDPTTAGIEVSTTLNRGQVTQLYHIHSGTTVAADDPVQVQFIVGDRKSFYEIRGFSAVPDSLWDNEYYSPVGGFADGNTDLYLYNPHPGTITIVYQDSLGSGSFDIPSGGTLAYSDGAGRTVPSGSGAHVFSDQIFWGIGSADTESQAYDWGFSLVPVWALSDEYYLGWAPGTSEGVPSANGSPLFITPVGDDTAVFVDYSPTDGVVDVTYLLDRLSSLRIFDPDNQNTGMHVWATGPIAAAWGEDPDTALTGNPYLDLGYTGLPVPDDWIDAVLAIDKSVDPSVVAARAGETAVFNLLVSTFDYPVDEVNVTDTLPEHWAYLAGSTTITLADGSVVAGPGADPAVAGQQLSWDLMQDMAPGQSLSIVFSAQTTAGITGGVSRNDAQARGTRLGGEQVFTPIDSAWIYHAVLTIDKDTSTPEATPGGTASYTIVLTNPSLVTITEVTVADDLPSGFTYAGGSITEVDATRTGVTEPSLDDSALAWGTWDIEPNGSLTIAFDVNVDPAVPPGTYDNTASADSSQTGSIVDQGEIGDDAHAPPGQDPEEDEDVTIGDVLPTIEVSKTADPTNVVEPGGMVALRVRISNTSAEQVKLTSLVDDIHGDLDGQGTCGLPQVISADANYECAFEVEVLGSAGDSQTDVVTASAVDDEGNPASAEDDATVVVIGTGKSLAGSNQPHTVSPSVAIGEILIYEASLVVPPGTLSNLTLTDVLDQGLAFVACTEIVPSSLDLSSSRGGFEVVCSTPTVDEEPVGSAAPADHGRRVSFDFGDLENAGEGAAVIAVRYQVVVLNNAANVDGVDLSNTARWQWEDGDLTSAAPEVGVVESALSLVKTASPGQAAPGTIITFALQIEHAAVSHSDAFDLVLTDTVPAGLTYIPGSLTWVQGHAPDLMEDAGAPTLRMEWDVLPNDGLRTVMRFKASLGNLAPGSVVTNSALLQWSSLPTEVRAPLSEHNTLSIERAYDPPSPVDVYVRVAETEVRRPLIPVTGFAPGKITRLPAPYGDLGLWEMQGMWLEIPSLGVRVPITGVPISEGGWDVTWLWDQAGYLEGTAFPT